MPLESEMRHPRGLSFHEERRVVILREVRKLSFDTIRLQVKNLQGQRPSKQLVCDTYNMFSKSRGRVISKYNKCGRKPYKVGDGDLAFLIRALLRMRKKCICTSTTLQRELARERGTTLSAAYIRKLLKTKGYHWLPRSKKPKYSEADKVKRLCFAEQVLAMTAAQLANHLALAMDGVVLTLPPADPHDRENYCRHGETHMWRTKSEAESDAVDGGSGKYGDQVPLGRAVPLWGGIASGGFAVVAFHDRRKLTSEEWQATAVVSGKLIDACRKARPDRHRGPWHILCDNESFLKKSLAAHRGVGAHLWHIPPRSPDLNPVERFWSWLRRKLRAMDLADLVAKRPPLGKMALKARVRQIASTNECTRVARNTANSLHKVCKLVQKKRGGASRG